MKQGLLALWLLFMAGCSGNPDRNATGIRTGIEDTKFSAGTVTYARGFTLKDQGRFIELTVTNPWQHAAGIEYHYLLSDTIRHSHLVNENTWAIRTPVKRVICLSTTHIGLISFIGRTRTIAGISGRDLVVNDTIHAAIGQSVFDVGYDEGLNYELILRLKPDVVFAYGVSVSVTNTVGKLNELGIPVILIGEYLEEDPLGKTEWVKAFAACYGVTQTVTEKFDSLANRYKRLREMASTVGNRPSVVLGLPWRGSWYVSGALSYMARLIEDSGGKYIWDDLLFNESRPMGLEKIYEKALPADIWLNPGEARTKKDILEVDPRFGKLRSLINDNVFNNDNRLSPSGGNDIYESGVVEPDIILSDLIAILHPHLLPSYKLKYYRKLQ